MNQTLSGHTLLIIIILITLGLYVIAKLKKNKVISSNKLNNHPKRNGVIRRPPKNLIGFKFKSKTGEFNKSTDSQIKQLKALVTEHLPDYYAVQRQNHIVLEKNTKKLAMLTIDKNVAIGRRRLGDIVVINFHQLPSIEELKIELSGL